MAVRFGLVWTALGLRVGALHSRSYLPTFRTTSAQTCADPMFPACFKVSPFEGHSGNPESTILNLFKRPICFQVFSSHRDPFPIPGSYGWIILADRSGRISCTSGYPTGTILKKVGYRVPDRILVLHRESEMLHGRTFYILRTISRDSSF